MFRYHQLNNLPDFFKNYFVTNNKIHEHKSQHEKCLKISRML